MFFLASPPLRDTSTEEEEFATMPFLLFGESSMVAPFVARLWSVGRYALASFLAALFTASAFADEAEMLARGKALATTVCIACHGADGNSVVATFPKIAGQHEAYLLKQLKGYKGLDKVPARENAIMQGQVAALTLDDLQAVAKYYASRHSRLNQPQSQNGVCSPRNCIARVMHNEV
jgi:cytochrome c553